VKAEPTVAVMMGEKPGGEEDSAEQSMGEVRAAAEDAAHALADALQAKDAKRIVRAFCSLSTLAGKLDELEDSGETDEEEAAESPMDEAAEE